MTGRSGAPLVGKAVSHYRVLAEIGKGAMGVVYEAEDLLLGRRVALKFLSDGSEDPQAVRRFQREARMASALNHPHICTIHDLGEFEGMPFIVMERLDGEPLKARLGGRPLPIPDLIDIATQIADALAAAHDKGIVHRDMKPANVFLCADGAAKILDFGIAKTVTTGRALAQTLVGVVEPAPADSSDDLTTPGTLIGTVAYMAPEQIRECEADARTDIFACGVLLYEMAVGWRPFVGVSRSDVTDAVLQATPAPPSAGNPAVPQELDLVILRCLEKDPAKRFPSGRELHAALRTIHPRAEAAPGAALPDPARTRVTRRRKPAVDSIAVLPFENRSADPDADFLGEGIVESLINSLSQLRRLRVVAHSLVSRFRGQEINPLAVGSELRVRSVLTGHVTRRGDTLVIGVELVDMLDGAQLWGQMYQRSMADLLRLIEALPHEICEALSLRVAGDDIRRKPERHTESARAYELYLRGRYHWNQRSVEAISTALEYFNQAIEEDRAFASAHTGIADCYTLLCFYDAAAPASVCPRAKAAAATALELDPSLAEAHASAGMLQAIWDFDWTEAERALTRAIALKPGYASAHQWYASCESALGRDDSAAAAIDRALELEPLSLAINVEAALVACRARRRDVAEARCAEMLRNGAGFARSVHHVRGRFSLQTCEWPRAIDEFRSALALSPSNVGDAAYLGLAYGLAGDMSDARASLRRLTEASQRQYVPVFYSALVHMGLGEVDQAFEALSAACEERYPQILYLRSDAIFDTLHADPRFAELIHRVGLPPVRQR